MSEKSNDDGIILALLQRFNTQRLPHTLAIKEKVDRGEPLSDTDITFLEQVFADAKTNKPLAERHPEYHALVSRVIGLYKEIMNKALANEKES